MVETVKADSFVTLHYRFSADDGMEFVNTFTDAPATLQMGNGQLAPPLERHLIGMAEGERKVIELAAGEAFGPRSDSMIRRVPLTQLPPKAAPELHAQIDFVSENGQPYSGLVREVFPDAVLIDFNHPLAGKGIRFEVEIVGVL